MTFGQMRVALKKLREDSMYLASLLQQTTKIGAASGEDKTCDSVIVEAGDILENLQKTLPKLAEAAALLEDDEYENWNGALSWLRE